jgi:hypothetical protein
MEGQVRTVKENKRERGTNVLSSGEGETYQNSKKTQQTRNTYSLLECRDRDESEQQRKASDSEREALTNCRSQNDGQVKVRTVKESQQARGTHILSGTAERTSQRIEIS